MARTSLDVVAPNFGRVPTYGQSGMQIGIFSVDGRRRIGCIEGDRVVDGRLEPGDLIATGTPSGVGFSRNPPQYLKAGDVVRIQIEKLGSIENKIIT
jgi:hypothetical protein